MTSSVDERLSPTDDRPASVRPAAGARADATMRAPVAEPSPGTARAVEPVPAAYPARLFALSPLAAALAACGAGTDTATTVTTAAGTTDASASASATTTGPVASITQPDAPATAATTQGAAPAAFGNRSLSRPEAARFLLHAQFTATQGEIDAVVAQGAGPWLDVQLARATDVTGWDWLNAKGYNVVWDATRWYDQITPSWFMAWQQLLGTGDAVRKRLALALSEFFVVSGNSVEVAWRSHAMAAWWDLLNRAVTGNFRTVLEEVTLNPAMGLYLSTRGNQKENPATGRAPDENYAREVMQLFTIGLYELELDGTPKLVGGKPVETYSIDDVTNLARVFTGYDFDPTGSVDNVYSRGSTSTDGNVANPLQLRSRMRLNASLHSTQAVTFLGTTIPSNTDGATALRIALDRLFNHSNVAPFFCKQMIQRLVTSNPSPQYVARVARVFVDNGRGVRGDLAAVFKAILLDPDANAASGLASSTFGKLREPMVRFVQWARTFGARSSDDSWKIYNLGDAGTSLGQMPLWAPSVFNYFRPGFVAPMTSSAAAGLVSPELQIVSEVSVAGYLNFIQTAIQSGIASASLAATYAVELPLAGDPAALVDHLDLVMTARQLGTQTRMTIADAIGRMPAATTPTAALNRVKGAVLLVMASPQYLVQR